VKSFVVKPTNKTMKRLFFFTLVIFQLHSFQASGQTRFSFGPFAGYAVPTEGLRYGIGAGFKAGMNVNKLYLGVALAGYMGDKKSIRYGAVSSLGIKGGKQEYKNTGLYLAADLGYDIGIPIGGTTTILQPYASAGLMVIPVVSSGVYGDNNTILARFAPGVGFVYRVPVSERLSVGLDYRMYFPGDGEFDFGDSGEIKHGFSTAIWFGAFSADLSFRL
jgi:hypothetical protein